MLPDRLTVCMALTYYAPYVSGLTEAARLVAEELVARGHRVVVATTRHDPELAPLEVVGGVEVHRAPVVARLGKGTISPAFPLLVRRLAAGADVLNLHLPLLEAGVLAHLTTRTPLVSTYQCDVNLPPGAVNDLQVRAVDASSRAALRQSAVVCVSSLDYATHSRLWAAMQGRARAISPPCVPREGGRPSFRDGGGLHVGFLGRLVEEKGVEHLVRAFRRLDDPAARLMVGGDHAKVAGGSVVEEVRVAAGGDARVRLLGFLPDDSLADFYASLDVFVLPSVNSLEAFGIVQVEAMTAGVPVVASDLPGVREPVRRAAFGEVVPPADDAALAQALQRAAGRGDRAEGAARAREAYSLATTVDAYLEVFQQVRRR